MELKPLKNGEVAITVTYHITDELVNRKLSFIRDWPSRVNGCYDGISAIYVDDGGRKKPTSTITFTEPGEHVVRIVLEDSTVVPYAILCHAYEVYSVEIPDTVTKIEWAAFDMSIKCPPVLPPNLKIIADSALEYAYNDVSFLQLPDSVETVERDNFNGVKHLAVGKNFQGDIGILCRKLEKVTIPDDNKYLEVKDGFVIDKESKKLIGILPGTFEDSTDVTIRFPEGISGFDSQIIKNFKKVSVYVPGSVEKCELALIGDYGAEDVRAVSCAEGVKIVDINGDNQKVKLSLPDTVTDLSLYNMTPIDFHFPKSVSEIALDVTMEELHIPSGAKLRNMTRNVNRLYLGQGVTLEEKVLQDNLFDDFKGEVFVEGAVHFDEWGKMKDDSVIHVQDEEIGRKIFNSKDFNKKVKIFIGDDKLLSEQEEGAQDKRIFNLLGVPDFPYPLQPIPSKYDPRGRIVTLLFNFQEKTTVEIEAEYYGGWGLLYTLDDKPVKKFKKSIEIPKGVHIVRLIFIDGMYHYDSGPAIEPACEVMLIDDNYSLEQIATNMKGVKHLILGARCHIENVNSLADLPHSQISVVPENQWLEYRDGCIIERETQQLILINSEVKKLPDGISKIGRGALRRYNNERLVIPCFSKSVCIGRGHGEDGVENLKELVFEEGIEEIDLRDYSFSQDVAITFPKTLNKLKFWGVKAKHITIPFACKLEFFRYSAIENLEFLGDVALRPKGSESYAMVFSDFSGNIHFHGAVDLFQMWKSDEDKPSCFIGEMKDDCTITVGNQETADAIKNCKDFNPKVKIIVE